MKDTSIIKKTVFLFCLMFSSFILIMAQGETENTTVENTTVTFDFSPLKNVYGLKHGGEQDYISNTDIKIQDVTLSLLNGICYYGGKNYYLRLKSKGEFSLKVPTNCKITKITFTPAPNNGGITKLANDKTTTKLNCTQKENCSLNIATTTIKFTANANDNSYLTKITVSYTRNKPEVSLDELDDATTQTIANNIGKTSAAINRAFNNNYMNSLCVPFDLSCSKIREIFGENTEIYRYTGSSDGDIHLKLSNEDLSAGTPVIIKPAIYVETPVFTGISISDKATQEIRHDDISLCGTYAPYEMNTDGSEVFLNTSQTFSKPKAGQNKMRGFRCYFKKNDNAVKDLTAIFDNAYTNCIKGMSSDAPHKSCHRYDANGIQSARQLTPGISICNGKKILIKR